MTLKESKNSDVFVVKSDIRMTSVQQGTHKRRRHIRAITHEAVMQLVLIIVGIFFLFPFVWLISTSLKTTDQIFRDIGHLIPNPIAWHNYPDAIAFIPFFTYTKNTLLITIPNVIGTLISCSLVAYGFSRIKWPGRNILFAVLLATLMLPGQVTMIPIFILFVWLGWYGTFLPLIVPHFFGGAFGIFMLRQFFMTIPMELSDAAKIDGCSEFRIYATIILPLSKPALATLGVFQFMGSWRDFMGPLIYLVDDSQFTLTLGLRHFLTQHGAEWAMLMAASAIVSFPMVVAFFLAQRTFIQGITVTGIKG
ncbi:MAG: L-arabinose transport system permease protein AraQ [Syntrophomonadaceae bacterium]|nr:L-arabinose transport system permease protein AraQ [Bacillota bacterium]